MTWDLVEEQQFKDIFNNVNQWLHFAEAKNVAVTTLDIALLAVYADYIEKVSQNLMWLVFCLSELALIVSLCIAIYSFFPKDYLHNAYNATNSRNVNPLYYKDIASWEAVSYAQFILSRYYGRVPSQTPEIIFIDYAEEIVTNARIAVRKNILFRNALICALIALACFAFACYAPQIRDCWHIISDVLFI